MNHRRRDERGGRRRRGGGDGDGDATIHDGDATMTTRENITRHDRVHSTPTRRGELEYLATKGWQQHRLDEKEALPEWVVSLPASALARGEAYVRAILVLTGRTIIATRRDAPGVRVSMNTRGSQPRLKGMPVFWFCTCL